MQKNICTWFCLDNKGQESNYAQMKSVGSSTSSRFVAVYLKNCIVLLTTCRKFNPDATLYFFTNTDLPDDLDGLSLSQLFGQLDVKVVQTEFEYIPPQGYYGAWRSVFFEFSIFKKMLTLASSEDDLFLLLDSDCVVTGNLAPLWEKAKATGCLTYRIDYDKDRVVQGLSRSQMKTVYEELLGHPIDEPPPYYGGEFYLASTAATRLIVKDFVELWPRLLERHAKGLPKFNQEEHTLSYLFYKNNLHTREAGEFIKRLWTQPFIFRNVEEKDVDMLIWHLPHEKKYGILRLFKQFASDLPAALAMDPIRFHRWLSRKLTIPRIPAGIYLGRILPVQAARVVYKLIKRK